MAANAAAAAAKKFLKETTVGAYLDDRVAAREDGCGDKYDDGRDEECKAVSPNAALSESLRVLAHNEVSSAPVFMDGVYYGFFSLADAVTSLATGPAAQLVTRSPGPEDLMTTVETMDKLTALATQFLLQPTWKVTGNDGQLAYRTYRQTSLLDLVTGGFLNPQKGSTSRLCHRVGVFQNEPEYKEGQAVFDLSQLSVVSQLDVVRVLHDNKEKLDGLADKTIEQLGLATADDAVTSVQATMSALNAFAVMHDKGVSAVAIINADGKVVGNLSASDLRWIERDMFGHLAMPVMLFLAVMSGCRNPGPVLTVKLNSKLGDCLKLMAENDIHHVHVISPSGKQQSIITPADILQYVAAAADEPNDV